jgi:hypothetical protein
MTMTRTRQKRQLFADPSQPAEADPYGILRGATIHSDSSQAQVLAVVFDLIGDGMTDEVQQAWNTLRLVERRLAVDFFLYDLEVEEVVPEVGETALPPLPLGWLQSLAYPLPTLREYASQAPSEPPPYLGTEPSPWPATSEGDGGNHG